MIQSHIICYLISNLRNAHTLIAANVKDTVRCMCYQTLYTIRYVSNISRCPPLIGYDTDFLPGFQTLHYQLDNITVLSRQRSAINDCYTDNGKTAASFCHFLFSFPLGISVIVDGSGDVFFCVQQSGIFIYLFIENKHLSLENKVRR